MSRQEPKSVWLGWDEPEVSGLTDAVRVVSL